MRVEGAASRVLSVHVIEPTVQIRPRLRRDPYGYCGFGPFPPHPMPIGVAPFCSYGCIQDSDCSANQLCECGDPVGHCTGAYCKTDADCALGFLCKAYDPSGGCGLTAYACQSPADTCGSDPDWTQPKVGNRCLFNPTAHNFECQSRDCVVTPF